VTAVISLFLDALCTLSLVGSVFSFPFMIRAPIMSSPPSEIDPLIPRTRYQPNSNEELPHRRPGPFEVSRMTRYGILAGVWSATFLAVCHVLLPWCFPATYTSAAFQVHKSYCPRDLISITLITFDVETLVPTSMLTFRLALPIDGMTLQCCLRYLPSFTSSTKLGG